MDKLAIFSIVAAIVAALVSWGVSPSIMRLARPAMYVLVVTAAVSGLLSIWF